MIATTSDSQAMSFVDDKIKENGLIEQISVHEHDGKLLIKTSDDFNSSNDDKQNIIISTVVDILLKSNKTDTLFTIGLNDQAEITMKFLDNFNILSLQSQEALLKKVSTITRKMAELKESEKINTSQWIN